MIEEALSELAKGVGHDSYPEIETNPHKYIPHDRLVILVKILVGREGSNASRGVINREIDNILNKPVESDNESKKLWSHLKSKNSRTLRNVSAQY